ncbi:MAG: hypothetical protein P8Z79_08920 [Sedimentisphaerales bacterium]
MAEEQATESKEAKAEAQGATESKAAPKSEGAKKWSRGIKDLGDKIVALTLMQAKELGDYLKEEYGIEPAAGGAVVMARETGAGGPCLWLTEVHTR